MTGRAAVLVVVLAVLAVSYASSLRAYLQQRAHIGDLKVQIEERRDGIADLQREKERWSDPAFVAAQARERFGYVRPGETAYVVLDEDGEPLEPEAELADPSDVDPEEPTAVYEDLWESVQLAGSPPAPGRPPRSEIGAVPGETGQSAEESAE